MRLLIHPAKIFVLFILIFWSVNSLTGKSEQHRYVFDHVGYDQGLSQVSVTDIIQDEQGFMWFGTMDGLNRFDGKRFKTYKHHPDKKNGLSSSIIWSIMEDRSGVLWVGTIRGGLNRFDAGTDTFTHFLDGESENLSSAGTDVFSLLEDSRNRIWVGTEAGLRRFNRKSEQLVRASTDIKGEKIPNERISTLIEDKKGNIWIGTISGLWCIDKTMHCIRVDCLGQGSAAAEVPITALFIDRTDGMWVCTRNHGLVSYDPGREHFKRIALTSRNHTERIPIIIGISEDQSNRLWIATARDGVKVLNRENGEIIHIAPDRRFPASLSSVYLNAIYTDRQGIVWIGNMDNGLNLYVPNRNKFGIHHINSNGDFEKRYSVIWHFLETDEDNLYLATEGGLAKFLRKENRYRIYRIKEADAKTDADNRLKTLHMDHRGRIWVGTFREGLYNFDPETERFTRFRYPGKVNRRVYQANILWVEQDRSGNYWISAFGLGLLKMDRDLTRVEQYLHHPGNHSSLGSDVCYAFSEDRKGRIWIGTLGMGLNLYNPEQKDFKRYSNRPGDSSSINSNTVLSIANGKDGCLWIGTSIGFARFCPESGLFQRFQQASGYIDAPVYSLIEDNSGHLWLAGNRLTRYDSKQGEYIFFNQRDGLQQGEFCTNAVLRSRYHQNMIYFGGSDGYNSVDTKEIQRNRYVPPVCFTRIEVNGVTIPIEKNHKMNGIRLGAAEIKMPHHLNNLFLEFISLDFSNPKTNKYAYRIDQDQMDWIQLGNSNSVFLSNLNPGVYRILVKGSNSDGLWNPVPRRLVIRIMPPFWQTWWFKTFLFLGLLLLSISLYKRQVKRIEMNVRKSEAVNRLLDKHKISKREREIIDLIVEGKSNRDIEELLYISISTVNNHIYNIYKKMNLKNRGDLVVLIKTAGIDKKTL